MHAPRRTTRSPRRWAAHLVRGALVALAVVLGLVAAFAIVGPRFGYSYAVVKSGSMAPAYPPGSIILIGETSPGSLEPGDVISFRAPGQGHDQIITHRVVQAREGAAGLEFVTRGDANDDVDSRAVPASDVRGRVLFGVPWVGSLAALLQQRGLFMGVVALCAAAVVVMEVTNIARELRRSRRKRPEPRPAHPLRLPTGGAGRASSLWVPPWAAGSPPVPSGGARGGVGFRWVRSGVLSALLALLLFWTMPLVGAQLTDSESTTGNPIPMRTYGTLRLELDTTAAGPFTFTITPSIAGNDQIAGCSTFSLADGQGHTCELLRSDTAYYISAPVLAGTLSVTGPCVAGISSTIEIAVSFTEPSLITCTIVHTPPEEPPPPDPPGG